MKKRILHKKTLAYADLPTNMKREICIENRAMALAFKTIADHMAVSVDEVAEDFFMAATEQVEKLPTAVLHKLFKARDKIRDTEPSGKDGEYKIASINLHTIKD